MTEILQRVVDGFIDGSLIALAAIAISIVFAVQRFANVAQAGLMSAGAYAGFVASGMGLGLLGIFAFAIFGGAILGIAVFVIAFRPLGRAAKITLLIASIAADLILRNALAMIWGNDVQGYRIGGMGSVVLGAVRVERAGLLISAVALTSMLIVWVVIHRTAVGRDMRALADLPELARLTDISPLRVNLWAWGMVGAIAAIAGVCVGWQSSVTPDLGWYALLPAFAAAILGGMGDIRGAVVGGFIMGIGGEVSMVVVPATYKPLLAFVVMTIVLLLRPQGLFGRVARV